MNNFWRIVFWCMTIALGFVNPLITFGLIILYYLPGILGSICEQSPDEKEEVIYENNENQPIQPNMTHYSEETLEEMK